MNYTVWWFKANAITGKIERVWRDFPTLQAALQFARASHKHHVTPIENCAWHPKAPRRG
jgi:hypothetical protein